MAKILAIDDNFDNIISLKAIIHDAFPNSKVVTATNGLQGIELAIAEDPDVILLDIFMPEMNGFEVCSRLKHNAQVCDIPVVFLTAQKGDKESRIRALELGAEAFLSKPIEVIELTAQIRAMLKIRTANKRKRDEKVRLEALVYKRTNELERELEERKLAEQALIESEERLRNIFEISPDAISITCLETSVYIDVNIAFEKLSGYSRAEIIGKTSLDLGFWMEPKGRGNYINLIKTKGAVDNYEVSFKISGNRTIHTIVSSRVITLSGKSYMLSAIKDITYRKIAEKALTESEEKLRTIFENVQDIYYEALIDGTILEVSPSVEIVFKNQHTRNELIGTNIYELYADANERKVLIESLKKNGSVTDYEILLWNKDGSVVPCSISSKLIFDDDGRPEKIIGSLRDVTERKRMQEAVEKRIIALTSPLSSDKAVLFDELFNLADIQRIQDEFAAATGVASIITHPDGTPITKPSQFTRFCIDIVRKTEKGCANCYKSDAALGTPNAKGAIVRTCLSGGLWDAGASITVGGKHIANWLIGQVRDETQNEENIRNYAREIEIDENLLIEAFHEVPSMTQHRFEQIAKALFTLANQLSVSAYQNVQQARFISERKHAEDVLTERESLLSALIESAPFDIWARDKNGVGFLENKYSIAHFGSILGKKQNDEAISSDITDRWIENNSLAMNGEVVNSECTYEIDGKELFFHQILAPIVVNGSNEGIIGFNIEITEEKRAEQAIKESNEFNHSLLQTIPFGMDIVDEHGNILFQSDYLTKLLEKDVKGEKCWNVYRDDHLKCPDCPLKDEIVVGKTSNCEATSVFGDRTFQIIHTGMMFKGKKAILEIFQDITERKRAEEQIKTLGKAIEQGPSSIVIANLKGDIEFVNNRFTEITQYTLEEVQGKKPRIFNPGHLNEKDTENLWTTLNDAKIWKGEVLNRRKDRTVFWEETTISTLIDAEGKISNFILIMDDITAKKQMVDELIVAKRKAEESDRLKSAFLANMSHEIRTPLNSILGFTELLSDPYIQSDEDQRLEYARIINSSGANLLSIINDIIDISKIEAGQVQVNNSCFLAQELIGIVCKEYGLKAQKKGIELIIDSTLPEEDLFLETDAAKVKQVLINFVGNALKFTEKGSISLGLKIAENSVLFYVKDTGIGIHKEFHSHIFERFRQIEGSATRKYGGNGLGLAISKSLIELLGGTIGMESEEGRGSTFFISLPLNNSVQSHQKTNGV